MATSRKGAHNKTQALRIHAKRQALRRYNVTLTSEDLSHLVNTIRRGRALFVARKSLRVSCWKVAHEDLEMVVLYDKQRRTIVTFLPPDCWEVRTSAASSEAPTTAVHRPFDASLKHPFAAFNDGFLSDNPAT
jgi:hypothetical protein